MKKILVVEDDPAFLKLLNSRLMNKGYKVIEATDGKKGLAAAIKEKPDLVILDIRMPVMDGITMLSLLRKNNYGKSAKVIMLTNLEPDNNIVGKAVSEQPAYYFVKSNINFNDLLKKIIELLAE